MLGSGQDIKKTAKERRNMGGCNRCRLEEEFNLPFSMAFQPIINTKNNKVFGYEALVRGLNGEGAASVLGMVNAENQYMFDQKCRVKAIELAAKLFPEGSDWKLFVNFMPNSVYDPRSCIKLTLETAERVNFPQESIVFEFTENERVDPKHALQICNTYRSLGIGTAIDDFGAGYASFGVLVNFQPDIVKIDMDLVRDIDKNNVKKTIVKNIVKMLEELEIAPLCEGVESLAERTVLEELGVKLMQGYFFAKPAFEELVIPEIA